MFLRGLSLTLGKSYLVQWELEVDEYQRFDCYPEDNADEAKCKARGCIWEVRGDTDDAHIHIYALFPYSIAKQT